MLERKNHSYSRLGKQNRQLKKLLYKCYLLRKINMKELNYNDTKICPKCGSRMQKWYLLGGRLRWECQCGYKKEIK